MTGSRTATPKIVGKKGIDPETAVAFFKKFGYDHTPEFWRWIHCNYPAGDSIIRALIRRDEIAAYYSVLPVELFDASRSRLIQGGLGIHLAASDDVALPALLDLMRSIRRATRDSGIAMVFGFPNDNSWPLLTRLV